MHTKLISVTSRAISLLRRLYRSAGIKWDELFNRSERSESVATFLAVLDLIKKGRITISDDNKTLALCKEQKHRSKKEKEDGNIAAGTI